MRRWVEKVKIDVNKPNERGIPAINIASFARKTDVVNYLISKGADINILDSHGGTPICYAIDNSDLPTFELLLSQPTLKIDIPIRIYLFAKQNIQLQGLLANFHLDADLIVNTTNKEGVRYAANVIEYAFAFNQITLNIQSQNSLITSVFGGEGNTAKLLSVFRIQSYMLSKLLDLNAKVFHVDLQLKKPPFLYFAVALKDSARIRDYVQSGKAPTEFTLSSLFVTDYFEMVDYFLDTEFIKMSNLPRLLYQDAPYSLELADYLSSKGYDASTPISTGASSPTKPRGPSVAATNNSLNSLMDVVLSRCTADSFASFLESKKPSNLFVSSAFKSAFANNRQDILAILKEKGYSPNKDLTYNENDLAKLLSAKEPSIYATLLDKGYSVDSPLGSKSILSILLKNRDLTGLLFFFKNLPPCAREVADKSEAFKIINLGSATLLNAYLRSTKNIHTIMSSPVSDGRTILARAIVAGESAREH